MDATLSEGAIEALDLVLEGSADEGRCGYFYVLLTLFYFRTLNSFSELVHIPTILPATGYSKVFPCYLFIILKATIAHENFLLSSYCVCLLVNIEAHAVHIPPICLV